MSFQRRYLSLNPPYGPKTMIRGRNSCSNPQRSHKMRIRNQKGDKLVKLVTFFIVEFILQNCEIGDFHQFDLASVLLLPSAEDR